MHDTHTSITQYAAISAKFDSHTRSAIILYSLVHVPVGLHTLPVGLPVDINTYYVYYMVLHFM